MITAAEGGHITARCTFFSGRKKIFSKNHCNKKDILLEISGNRGLNSRSSTIGNSIDMYNNMKPVEFQFDSYVLSLFYYIHRQFRCENKTE